jgi:hypothetical protein
MAITICTVTGTVRSPAGGGLPGVTVRANLVTPFVHSADGSFIATYEVTTTTASDGTWSLNLIETATPQTTVTIAFDYPAGSQNYQRREYTIMVPNQASATFSSLVTAGPF